MQEVREITELYRLEKVLRSGVSGVIFRAADPKTQGRVAIKLINRGASPDLEGCRDRFFHVAGVARSLGLAIFPTVHDFGLTPDGTAFLVLSYLDCKPLEALSGAPSEQVLRLMGEVVDGLEALAASGVIHQNLSPDNLVVVEGPNGPQLKVLGFGSAAFRPEEVNAARLAHPAEGMSFAAPELLTPAGGAPPDWRSDLYSLNLIICHLLGIRVAPSDQATPEIEVPETVAASLADAQALQSILQRCLARDPEQRPSSYDEVRRSFNLAFSGSAERELSFAETRAMEVPAQPVAAGPAYRTVVMSSEELAGTAGPEAAGIEEIPGVTAIPYEPEEAAAPAEPVTAEEGVAEPQVPGTAVPAAPAGEEGEEEAVGRTVHIDLAAITAMEEGEGAVGEGEAAPPATGEAVIPAPPGFETVRAEAPLAEAPPRAEEAPPAEEVPPTPPEVPAHKEDLVSTASRKVVPVIPPRPAAPPPPPQPVVAPTPAPAAAPAPAPAAAPAPPTARRPAAKLSPLLIVIPVAVVVLGALAFVAWRFIAAARSKPVVVAATPVPVLPTPRPQPTVPPRALAQLQQAEDLYAAKDVAGAEKAFEEISADEVATLPPDVQARYQALADTLTKQRREALVSELERGVASGNVDLLRRVVSGLGKQNQADLPASLKFQQQYALAKKALDVNAQLAKAVKDKDSLAIVRHSSALIALLPKTKQAYDLRDKAAAGVEADADAQAKNGQFDTALGRLQALQTAWPDRPGLAQRIAHISTEHETEHKMDAILASAAQTEQEKKPEKGLAVLKGVTPSPRFEARFRELHDRLTKQLEELDRQPPVVQVKQGFKMEYEKNKSAIIPLKISDDHAVKSAQAFARVEGSKSYTELPLRHVSGDDYTLEVPASFHRNETVELYLMAADYSDHKTTLGTPEAPLKLKRKHWLF